MSAEFAKRKIRPAHDRDVGLFVFEMKLQDLEFKLLESDADPDFMEVRVDFVSGLCINELNAILNGMFENIVISSSEMVYLEYNSERMYNCSWSV